MGAIGITLLVVFVIVSVLLVLLVLVQDDGQSGMGGLMGGRGTAAFGSHSASVLTKATAVLVFLFFGLALGLAIINKKPNLVDDLAETVVTPAEITADGTESDSEAASSNEATEWWSTSESDKKAE